MFVTDLDHADDICCLEDRPVKAEKMLELVMDTAAKVGLSINVLKKKFCTHDRMVQRQYNGEPLQAVQEFTYLENKIRLDGNITITAKAADGFKMLSNLWNQRSVPPCLKIKVNNACVRGVLLCGCESWPIKQSDINMMDSFENRCIQRIIPQGHALWTNQIRKEGCRPQQDYQKPPT